MDPLETVTAEFAAARRHEAISTPFAPSERHLLESLISGLAGKRFLLVETTGGIVGWRHRDDLKRPVATKSLVSVRAGVGQ